MRSNQFTFLILSSLFIQAILPAGSAGTTSQGNFHLFLLVGQSNMAGRGKVTPADKKPHSRVLMLNKAGNGFRCRSFAFRQTGHGGGGAWQNLWGDGCAKESRCYGWTDPLCPWRFSDFGLATQQVLQAHPWSSLGRCDEEGETGDEGGIPQGNSLASGESDSKKGLAEIYEKKLHDLVTRFRKELAVPHVPFVAGQMGLFKERPWSDAKKRVDQAHRELPQKLKHAGFVNAQGLRHKGDKTHSTLPRIGNWGVVTRMFFSS